MKRSLYPFSILLFLGVFAVHFTVYAGDPQIQATPEPVEGEKAATINNTKSNTYRQIQPNPETQPTPGPLKGLVKVSRSNNYRQIQPNPAQPTPEPVVKGSKSDTSE